MAPRILFLALLLICKASIVGVSHSNENDMLPLSLQLTNDPRLRPVKNWSTRKPQQDSFSQGEAVLNSTCTPLKKQNLPLESLRRGQPLLLTSLFLALAIGFLLGKRSHSCSELDNTSSDDQSLSGFFDDMSPIQSSPEEFSPVFEVLNTGNYQRQFHVLKALSEDMDLARHKLEDEVYAIKKVRVLVNPTQDITNEFHNLFALMQLQSKHLIRYNTCWVELAITQPPLHVDLHLQMEYFPSSTLQEWIQQRKTVHMGDNLELFLQAAKGIAHFHKRNVVHARINSKNILVDKYMKLKIAGFTMNSADKKQDVRGLANVLEELCGSARLPLQSELIDWLSCEAPDIHDVINSKLLSRWINEQYSKNTIS